MNQALALNIVIVIAVIVCMVVLTNPLAMFGLLLIKELPYDLLVDEQVRGPEERDPAIGF